MNSIKPSEGPQPSTVLTAAGDDAVQGCWQIVTETGSTYTVDLDQRRLTRVPEAGSLCRDYEPVTLHEVVTCTVGTSAILLIQVRDGAIPTYRITSHVLRIEPARRIDGADGR